MSERRIELILEWIEAHPESFESVKGKIKELAAANQQAIYLSMKNAKTKQEQVRTMEAASEAYTDEEAAILRKNVPGFKQYEDVMDRVQKKQQAQQDAIKNLGMQFQTAGWRIGFFGWIVSYSARSVLRIFSQLFNVFTRIIKLVVDWPTSLTKVATALALLENRGLLTADMQEFLEKTMQRLIDVGPDIRALWAGFEAAMIGIAVLLLSKVVPAFLRGLDKLAKFIEGNEDRIADLAERIFSEFIPALIDVLPAIIDIVTALMPLIPIVAGLIRVFGPLLPLLFLVGQAMWFIGPIFTAIGAVIQLLALGPVAGLLSSFVALLPAILAITGAIGSAILVFQLLVGRIGPIPALIAAVVTGLIVGIATFKLLTLALGVLSPVLVGAGGALGAFGAAAIPAIPIVIALGAAILMAGAGFALAGAGVWLAVQAIIQLIGCIDSLMPLAPALLGVAAGMIAVAAAGLAMLPAVVGVGAMAFALGGLALAVGGLALALWGLVAAAKAFEEVGGVVNNVVGAVTGGISNLGNALMSLCFRHATPYAEAFADTVTDVTGKTVELEKDISSLGKGLRGLSESEVGIGGVGGAAGGGTQYVTIHAPISIESISSEVDLENATEEINKAIANSVRRRG